MDIENHAVERDLHTTELQGKQIGTAELEKSSSPDHEVPSTSRPNSQGITEDPATDVTMPLNWSTWKKIVNMGVPSIASLVVTFGTSVYTPAIPVVMMDFGVSETVAILPLTTYVLGLAFGPMISAPISETLGRLGTYRIAIPIGALFSLGAGYAPSIAALCILRFFAGFFSGAILPVTAGTAADIFSPQRFAVAGAWLLYFPFLGPALGPVVGGYVTDSSWKWSQYTLAIVSAVTYLPVYFLEETYAKIIIARRNQKQQAAEAPTKPPAKTIILGILFITLLRPAKMLVTEPIVAFLSIYVAFNFAVLFTFFASVPYVFALVYRFDRGETGLVFLSIGLGCTLVLPTAIYLDKLIYQKKWKLRPGNVEPEHRLWVAMLGALGLPIGLFWFAWSARQEVHWIVPVLGMVPFGWGNLCIYVGTCLYLLDTYAALTAASAIAANGLLRYIMGATFPLFTTAMYERLGIAWATSLLGFVSLAMLPIPWVLYQWGPKIRAASKFETKE
ncbi:major facilitator superfamily domain-containing protein [Rhexocercosporidium sp. MPI-PUGE-AT-0058]|nr:major facilitator superfamily domain-containing protein [Rhexocercosporidium sp. MPI-PUGE-AT-0058]